MGDNMFKIQHILRDYNIIARTLVSNDTYI